MAGIIFYSLLIGYIFLGPKKKKAEIAAAPASTGANEIPSVESDEFGDWIGQDGNLEKLLDSVAK